MGSKIPAQVFNETHRSLPYLAGAGILHRTWEWTQANPSPELERFEHYLSYGLFILAETPQNQCPKDFSLPAHDAAFQQIASRMAQRDNTDRALKLVATEVLAIVKPLRSNQKKWRDVVRTKSLLTFPLTKALEKQRGKVAWR